MISGIVPPLLFYSLLAISIVARLFSYIYTKKDVLVLFCVWFIYFIRILQCSMIYICYIYRTDLRLQRPMLRDSRNNTIFVPHKQHNQRTHIGISGSIMI